MHGIQPLACRRCLRIAIHLESGKSFQETGLEDGKGVCMDIAKWWEQVIGRRNIESFIDQVMRTESGKRITRVTFGL